MRDNGLYIDATKGCQIRLMNSERRQTKSSSFEHGFPMHSVRMNDDSLKKDTFFTLLKPSRQIRRVKIYM